MIFLSVYNTVLPNPAFKKGYLRGSQTPAWVHLANQSETFLEFERSPICLLQKTFKQF